MKSVFHFVLFIASLLLFSCAEKTQPNSDADIIDKVITTVMTTKTGETVELPDLYDRTVGNIPQDNDQHVILADRLELRGFKKTASGRRDQQLSGRRMFVVTMQKDDCQCEVSKVFYSTANVSEYFVSERIACQTINTK